MEEPRREAESGRGGQLGQGPSVGGRLCGQARRASGGPASVLFFKGGEVIKIRGGGQVVKKGAGQGVTGRDSCRGSRKREPGTGLGGREQKSV